MKAAEIRSRFLKYFQKHGHTLVESSSLIPQNDPTLLFTNAGMVQFKDVFTGKEKRPYKRATTVQKCVRAGGKHNDLENVGFTARHHTFFEMLGNFSFGDYFKKEAIAFAWEFVTKDLQLPKDRLYVTVHKSDDEAAELWHKDQGIAKDRIFRFDEDNFWAMGETGPCGPCSEIFVDRGNKFGCGKSTCNVGCNCDRYMEIWNLVFMQFERKTDGTMTPLPKPSVDTGAGLERIASVLQNVDSNFEIDLFQDIIGKVAKAAGIKNPRDPAIQTGLRVIADHARATTFLIGDGVMPSNEGRGYVLRRIMRRGVRYGRKIGFSGPFLHNACVDVIHQMQDAYPDLKDKVELIRKSVLAEEEQFFRTLERGLELLDQELPKAKKSGVLPGETVFKLYDTYGFPVDLTRVISQEAGIKVDEQGFENAMERQRTESRKNWKGSGDQGVDPIYFTLHTDLQNKKIPTSFTGYETLETSSPCLALLAETPTGLKAISTSNGTETILQAVFQDTPFYGESGGQVGDVGTIASEKKDSDSFLGTVLDSQKPIPELIVLRIQPVKGSLKIGKVYHQKVDAQKRALTARNHTATHLLHWALRKTLGTHVRQAGSLVTPELLRFDFSHFQPITPDELRKIEDMINEKIWESSKVAHEVMQKEAATKAGAIAFFGEKYGDEVRVIQVGNYSVELCGGTHVHNSGEIHVFKIAQESGIAAGVRRIVAYTSKGAFDYLREKDDQVKQIRDRLKASNAQEIFIKLEKMTESERDLRKQVERLQSQNAKGEVNELLDKKIDLGSFHFVTNLCQSDSAGIKKLREIAEQLVQKDTKLVVVLGMEDPTSQKAFLLSAKGANVPKEIQAQLIIQAISSEIEGKGGGKPELAQAGGTRLNGVTSALKKAEEWIKKNAT